ncbi:MAG: hypothetical protein NVSMB56_10710 [Pyrinomonadaceae bacterium]
MHLGVFDPVSQSLMRHGDTPLSALPTLYLFGFIALTGLTAGVAVDRFGMSYALPYLLAVTFVCLALDLFGGRFASINLKFLSLAVSMLCAAIFVHLRRLLKLERIMSDSLAQLMTHTQIDANTAGASLKNGLKLLETVLPLDEAVVFRFDEQGALTPDARLRRYANESAQEIAASNVASNNIGKDHNRNVDWRAGVAMCEKALLKGEMVITSNGVEKTAGSGEDFTAPDSTGVNVALALQHEKQFVGALLLRLRENFDEADRPLLLSVSAQLARDLQRDYLRVYEKSHTRASLPSARVAAYRLQALDVLKGISAERDFAAHVLRETSDGHAVALLDGRIVSVNQPLLRAAQLSEEDARGLDIFALLTHFRTDVFNDPALAVRRVLQSGQPYERELIFAERNMTFNLRIALMCVESSAEEMGAPICFVVTVRDVSRVKEYEKWRGETVSLMGHELRTPLTSIIGFAELLSSDDVLPEGVRGFSSIIDAEAQRMARMLDTLLSMTRLEEKDKQGMAISPVVLPDVVRETIATMQETAKRKRIRLVEKPNGMIPPVAADRSQILQVVMNLVDNAIRYSPERTTVMISTALEPETVRLAIEDRGYGIPPEAIEKVWEKFYRVARDGHDKEEESTGLGLSVVKDIIEAHGGTVELESEVGHGSKFSFTLPRL